MSRQSTQEKSGPEEGIVIQAVVPGAVQNAPGQGADQNGMTFGKIERFIVGADGFGAHRQKLLSARVMP